MGYCYQSYAVQAKRAEIPDLIKYYFIRALMLDITMKVASLTLWQTDKMGDEWYRRVATLMNLDMYSAIHPFDKEDVDLEPTRFGADEISSWWARYKHVAPDCLVDMIWAEVDL